MKNQKPNIFIVEDNLVYQNILRFDLERLGNNIHSFTKGEDVLTQLHLNPEIVILDYRLEGDMSGMDVLKAIKSINPDIQVIILSSQEDIETAINTLKYGAFDYVEKTENALAETIQVINRIYKIKEEAEQLERTSRLKKAGLVAFAILGIIVTTIIAL